MYSLRNLSSCVNPFFLLRDVSMAVYHAAFSGRLPTPLCDAARRNFHVTLFLRETCGKNPLDWGGGELDIEQRVDNARQISSKTPLSSPSFHLGVIFICLLCFQFRCSPLCNLIALSVWGYFVCMLSACFFASRKARGWPIGKWAYVFE
jgi:hypothetical protein